MTLLVLTLSNKTLLPPIKFYVGSYILLPKILIGLFQTNYDTMLFQIWLFHFGIILRHLFQIRLETIQFIVGLLVELVEIGILLLQVLTLPISLLSFIQLVGQVFLSFDYD